MNRVNFRYRLNGVQYTFSANAPYTEGHCLTANEAMALNVLRSENIREGVRADFNEAGSALGKGEVLSVEFVSKLQGIVDEYDLNYQFGQNNSNKEKLGAIEKEARLLASVRAPEGASEEEIELLAQSIDLVSEARERVALRVKIMASEMEDLLK